MWQQSYETVTNEVTKEQVWKTWADVNHWHDWDDGIEYARTNDEFKVGCRFTLKPKGGPSVTIEIIESMFQKHFTDLTKFPFARMFGRHEMESLPDGGLRLKTTMSLTGPLSFLWRKLVAQKIADDLPVDTAKLIEAAKRR